MFRSLSNDKLVIIATVWCMVSRGSLTLENRVRVMMKRNVGNNLPPQPIDSSFSRLRVLVDGVKNVHGAGTVALRTDGG